MCESKNCASLQAGIFRPASQAFICPAHLGCFLRFTRVTAKKLLQLHIQGAKRHSSKAAVLQGDEEDDEEAQARSLAGLKVKHTADEMLEGETMILTLADKNILDDKGDLSDGEDELENVLAVCHDAGVLTCVPASSGIKF